MVHMRSDALVLGMFYTITQWRQGQVEVSSRTDRGGTSTRYASMPSLDDAKHVGEIWLRTITQRRMAQARRVAAFQISQSMRQFGAPDRPALPEGLEVRQELSPEDQ